MTYDNLGQIIEESRRSMEPDLSYYLDSGAGTGSTVLGNVGAFSRDVLMPRPLQNSIPAEQISSKVILPGLSQAVNAIFIAPTAWHKLFHEKGEIATLLAAKKHQALMIISSFSQTSWQEFIDANEGPINQSFYQMLMVKDEGLMISSMEVARDAGCGAIVITIDAPNGCTACRPESGTDRVHIDAMPLLPRRSNDGVSTLWQYLQKYTIGGTYDWEYIEKLIKKSPLPIYLKGVLHPDDVEKAKNVGATGVIVSNHGGRQMDGVISSYDAMKRIQDMNQGEALVLMDGGVRSGIDALKAIMAGAHAVGIGRAIHYGLSVGGGEGVSEVLRIIQNELLVGLQLTGFSSVEDARKNGRQRIARI